MSLNLIEKNCVRVSTKENGVTTKQGSGVVVTFNNKHYVLTAYHCIKTSDVEKIIVENQLQYNSEPYSINVISVIKFDTEKDWILLEIDYEENFENSRDSKVAKNFIPDTEINFCGYQNVTKGEYRPWKGKVLNTSDYGFKLKIVEDTFQQGGEEGKYLANGLSGSGVYVIKNGEPFLIGILCSVKTEKAFNDDIECCSINCIEDLITNFDDLHSLENLKNWESNIERNKINSDIEIWKTLNVDDFKNIDRKNNILFRDPSEANETTSKNIQRYLSTKQTIEDFEKQYPELFIKFKILVREFNESVKEDYSRDVQNANEAKDVKISLQNHLRNELNNIFPNEMLVKLDLTKFQIIEWLMNCSLNFVKI